MASGPTGLVQGRTPSSALRVKRECRPATTKTVAAGQPKRLSLHGSSSRWTARGAVPTWVALVNALLFHLGGPGRGGLDLLLLPGTLLLLLDCLAGSGLELRP
jgi:hypothetical protein